MGTPRSIFGHSLEWQQAYLTASPEESAQRDLVAQLALPMDASQTREQAKRVEALQKLIAGMTPTSARRMYQRLNANSDALGQLFHLTLHHTTRKSLLGQLDAKQRDNDRGTAPVNRGTDNRGMDNRAATPIPPPVPPPPPPDPRFPPPPPPLIDPRIDKIDPTKDTGGSGSRSWVWSILTSAAASLGMVVSSSLLALSPAAVVAAIEAAWIYFQTTEGPDAILIGYAAEEAARAALIETLAGKASAVYDLNKLQRSFPYVDVMFPEEISSIKTHGVVNPQGTSALSAYTSDLIRSIKGGDTLDETVDLLLKNRQKLDAAWPTKLKNVKKVDLGKYLRFESPFRVPNDHVPLIGNWLEENLTDRLISSERPLAEELLGKSLKGIQNKDISAADRKKVAAFVKQQITRFKPLGLGSDDLRELAEAARKYLPKDQAEKFTKKNAARLKQKSFID